MDKPIWSEEIKTQYLSGASNQFLIYGNVHDRMLVPNRATNEPEMGDLIDYLVEQQLQKFDLVISYELGAGLRIKSGNDFFRKIRPGEELPKEPAQAIGYLDHLFRYVVNLRNIDSKDDSLAGKNHNVAVIIKSADLLFPVAKQSRDYQLSSMASVVRSWSRESHFLEQNMAVFLVAENLNDLNHLLANNGQACRVQIKMPSTGELTTLFKLFNKQYPKAMANFKKQADLVAGRLAGASLSSIEKLLKHREYIDEPLVEGDLGELKKQLVEKDAQGLIEFIEPTRTLDDFFGSAAVKDWVRQDIELWQQNDLEAMPMGYLLCGPVGTGKTYMVECLAGEAGIPVVKMKNFRDRWVGSTEGNLEKIFQLLQALGRCIVFVDEADQALGSRDSGNSDSGLSGRVYSMMAKEMSNTKNRGKILWVLASSRPDLIEVDLKRPGRVGVKIPLFPAVDKQGGYQLIRALSKKHKLSLPKQCPESLLELIPDLITPGTAESIATKTYRLVKTRDVDPEEGLRDCLDEYQNPIPLDVMERQIRLAAREASDLEFVPELFRKYLN